jgi:hypothetical protein
MGGEGEGALRRILFPHFNKPAMGMAEIIKWVF